MSINLLIKYLLVLLLLLLPSWAVISAQVSYLVGFDQLVTSSRYLIIFSCILLCVIGLLFSDFKLIYSFGFFALLFYTFYSLAHLIGDTEPILLFEGFRHEVLFVILGFSLLIYGLSNESVSYLPRLNVVFYTVLINGFFAISFAVWQFFDINILEILYRKPLEDIGNLTLAIGYRLTSTMVNPINFGAFLVLFYLVIHYFYEERKIGFFIYLILSIFIIVLVVGSLSRLALLALIFVLTLLYFYKASLLKMFVPVFMIFLFVIYVVNYVDLGLLNSRFETIFTLSTFTENARVNNWFLAVSSLDLYQYLWGRGIGASSPDSSVVSVSSAQAIENGYISIFYQYGLFGFIMAFIIFLRFIYVGYSLVKINAAVGKFVIGFILFFFAMTLGNDFFRNSPFVFYFWFFYVYFEIVYTRRQLFFSDIESDRKRRLKLK